MRLPILLAVAILALSVAGQAAANPRGRHCGHTARLQGRMFDIYEERGREPCRTVKPVMTLYLRTFDFAPPWFCALGHSAQPWAASCARGHVLLRAYAPD
ncbi:MAG TPA: hypothetical protein VE684_12710 [Crenalkalicoccus sp.]|nr:hypothetical protein [Crenalkalicoccus sp.]